MVDIKKCRKIINDACNGKWTMKIPVDINNDSDVVLSNAIDELEKYQNKGHEEKSENPYTDLKVNIRYTIEGSQYCKEIREVNDQPAFGSALCEKCIKKGCKFLNICLELHEMNRKNHKSKKD